MTLVLKGGVLTFDGSVVEAFGFGVGNQSRRIHVAMVTSVETSEGGRFSDPSLTVKARDLGYEVFATFTEEEAANPDVAAFADAVRNGSPNLEAGG